MPAVARGSGVDTVNSLTGAGIGCNSPQTVTTDTCSGDVFCNGTGVVRLDDTVQIHKKSGCIIDDQDSLTSASPTVFVNGKGTGRLGDQYTSDNTITSGSPNVFANG